MPEISRFYVVIIRMFMEPNAPNHRPHFHAYYQMMSQSMQLIVLK